MSWKLHVERDTVMRVVKDDLLRWICERHAIDCSLDKRLLRDKALELAGNHGLIGFKCSEGWLTSFLKRYGFLRNREGSFGPIFTNYRLWVDIMRSVITRYKHKDLFHLDELTMYSDVSPAKISSAIYRNELGTMKKTTVLMCCNASGTEKLPLLICGSYPAVMTGKDHVYSHSENASINDGLFREWLIRLNDRMSSSDRKILLLLHRNRLGAFRGLELSNVKHLFFPDDFPPSLRPLKRDIFHFIKMIYRSKYVEGIREHRRRWNVENVVTSLVEAWRKVPRDLIIASFQRTNFRTDDCFLEIHCDAWKEPKTGLSFEKFVTFDDDLSTNVSYEQRESTCTSHGYNLRTREIIRSVDNHFDSAINSKKENSIDHRPQVNENLKKIPVKRKDRKRKSSLKRSRDKAQLDEYEEANRTKASDESIPKNDEDIVTIPAKFPKIVDIQTIEGAAQSSKSEIYSAREIVNATSRTNMDCDRELDNEEANNEEENKNSRVSSNERSIEPSPEVDNASGSDIASQQVPDDTFTVDSDTKEQNAETVSCVIPSVETKSTDLDGNGGHSPQKSLKRRRSRSNIEESQTNCNDGEPKRKRSRPDSDWTKQYEATFVFGSSDLARTISTASIDILSSDEVQQLRPRRSCETERSIFTIRPRKD